MATNSGERDAAPSALNKSARSAPLAAVRSIYAVLRQNTEDISFEFSLACFGETVKGGGGQHFWLWTEHA